MNVAHENYFYEVKELSKREIELIYGMTIRGKTGIQKTVGENWLNLYCASFKFARAVGKYLPGNDACYIFNHIVWLSTNNFTPTKSSRGF